MTQLDTSHGATRVQLGAVERWIVITMAALFISGGTWFASQTWARLDKVVEQQVELSKQQAVANTQMAAIVGQLTEIPQLRSDVAQLKTDSATIKAQLAAEGALIRHQGAAR